MYIFISLNAVHSDNTCIICIASKRERERERERETQLGGGFNRPLMPWGRRDTYIYIYIYLCVCIYIYV